MEINWWMDFFLYVIKLDQVVSRIVWVLVWCNVNIIYYYGLYFEYYSVENFWMFCQDLFILMVDNFLLMYRMCM